MLCMLCTQKSKRTNQVHNLHNMHNHLVRPSERAEAVDRRGQRRKVLCVGELETGCVVVQEFVNASNVFILRNLEGGGRAGGRA